LPILWSKTPSGEQKTENFSVPYRVVLKRGRTTDVAEPWIRTISRPNI